MPSKIRKFIKMDALRPFSIPIKSIGNTTHQFDFQVGNDFFETFEDSIIKDGNFSIRLELDKRTTVMDLRFIIKGSFQTECDRCLAGINLEIEGEHDLIAKFSESEDEEAEVIYIHPMAHEFNVAKYIYEYVCLSIPISKSCQGDAKPQCDATMQDYLGVDETEEDTNPTNNPFLDALKDFNQDN